MALGLEEQKTQNQITKTLTTAGFKDADIAKTISAILPPDSAGCRGNTILINKGIPAGGVEIIRATAKDRSTDGNHSGEIFTGSKPFTLDQ